MVDIIVKILSCGILMFYIRLIGVEPITFGTEIQYSVRLSYKRFTVMHFILL